MNRLTAEWVQKAEDDFVVAQKMYRACKRPVYDAVCFHAQQCAEKYLKAFLQEHDQDTPRSINCSIFSNSAKRWMPVWKFLSLT